MKTTKNTIKNGHLFQIMLNLISQQDNIDKLYSCAKNLSEPKYEILIKKREDVGKNHFGDNQMHLLSFQIQWMTFIDDYNPNRKRKILIVFDDMVADIMTNKKLQAIIR